MALSVINITPGAGAQVRVDQDGGGATMQMIKLAEGTLGSNNLIPATVAAGVLVNVSNASLTVAGAVNATPIGNTAVVNAAATSLNVAAAAAAPVAVRLSNGGAFVDTIPVSIGATVTVAGTVGITGTPAVSQSGSWNIGAVATITNPVTVTGSVAITGTPAVSGTVTGNQGAPAAQANAWPVKLSDGTNSPAMQNVSGVYALPVKVLAQAGGGYSQQDKTAFTEGTTFVEVIGGVYNDAFAGNPSAGQASVVRITAYRGLHMNLRDNSGNELGIAAKPVRVDPTGTTAQPVSGTVTTNQGAPNTPANAWPVQNTPSGGGGGAAQTPWRNHVAFSASLADQTIHAPAAGKTAFVEGLIVTPTTAGALLKVYDQTNADANMIYVGQPPLGSIVITPARPIPLSAANNILRWATGASAAGDITAWGYDA